MVRVSARLHNTDCMAAFKELADASVDAVITDPPYFLDKLGSTWDTQNMKYATKGSAVTSLPVGMKFDPRQGRSFQEFMQEVATESLRVLKPGGYFLSFSAPRLYHRLAVAVEDAGFEIRDMWAWIYTQNQVKAMSVARFLDAGKVGRLSRAELDRLNAELEIWKTPQVKSCIEPIVFAQSPKVDAEGRPQTFLDNWLRNHVGLVNTQTGVGSARNMVTANILTTGPVNSAMDKAFLVPKPTKREKGETTHVSVKPLTLMDQLIRATVPEGGQVLDPFNGSGSTGISALRMSRNYVGFELDSTYFEQSKARFEDALADEGLSWSQEGTTATATVETTPLTYQSYTLAADNASSLDNGARQ